MIKKGLPTVSTSPFLHDAATTPRIMWEVIWALIPVVGVAYYYFGLGALAVVVFSTAGALLTEWILAPKGRKIKSVKDGSTWLTGMLLGLSLPPGFPFWMAFLGEIVGIAMGKVIWGGLGQNVFNPALVGRAFLQAAFPAAITTWGLPNHAWFSFRGNNLAFPFFQGKNVDAITAATPLSKMKFDHDFGQLPDLFFGNVAGSAGETATWVILMAGVFLLWRKIIDWRIPVSVLGSVVVLSGIFWILQPEIYPSPWFMLSSGGLMLGTVFMATDPVSSPITPRGLWIFGAGIGALVVLIRLWGGLPEGVMYAILLMNAATPLINKVTRIKPYGY